ncbi:MAG: hypothetical protein KAX49_08860 [Halanaerobiales bacterium]|nr:hypothetical protein [Halanaerobiales bacterium]
MQERLLHGLMDEAKLKRLCVKIEKSDLELIWVHPLQLATVKEELKMSQIKIGVIIDFPLGGSTPKMKAFNATELKDMGVDELGLMIFSGYLEEDKLNMLKEEIDLVQTVIGKTPFCLVFDPSFLNRKQIQLLEEFIDNEGLEFYKLPKGYQIDQYSVKI